MRVDVDRFQYFLTDPITDYRRLYMDGSPVGDQWVPPKVYVQYLKKPVGDFYNANHSVLITSARATETLYKHFKWAGELLPLPYKEQTFMLLNVTQCIDVLDEDRTEFCMGKTSGVRLGITQYAFRPDRFVGTSLFKIPQYNGSEIFVVEGVNDSSTEFREDVAAAGLKGLRFREVWDDVSGPVEGRMDIHIF